ncbi:SRSF protein kinase 3-like isoform X2 [Drosophila mauritiana]|uniref:non-specific serine/threonine protein kinase n=1 Tax=Drosophila mauritiana TaxID=7226 RepID=A0A6P8KRL7_DROMA|nr:SRSF protein kinase 3-like isoform X2 [Drosophila mauritiana]
MKKFRPPEEVKRNVRPRKVSPKVFQDTSPSQMESCGEAQMANASTMDGDMDTDLDMKRKMAEDRMTDLSNTVKVPARCKDQKQLTSLTDLKSKMQKEKQSPSPSYNQEQFDQRPKKSSKQKIRIPLLSDDQLTGLNPPCDAVGELSHGNESNMSHEMKPQSNGYSINDDREYEYSESDEENCSDYVSVGYSVAIGDIFAKRYHVFKKLGWGNFSTVWLCYDSQMDRYCAVKVATAEIDGTGEVVLFKRLHDNHKYRSHVVGFYDYFKVTGPKGTHDCLVLEVLGDNLLNLMKRCTDKGLPICNIKQIAQQVLTGLHFLHDECRVMHTDLKPENVLLASNEGILRTEASKAIEVYLEANEEEQIPCSKMTTMAERQMQTKTKEALSFFRNHRRLLRRQGIEDLLHLAERGLIEPITAAMAVSDNLPCIPFGFDGLKMMNDSDCQTVRNAKLPEMKDMVYECDKIRLCLKSPELFLRHVLGIIKNLDEKELSTQDNRMRASGRAQTKKNAMSSSTAYTTETGCRPKRRLNLNDIYPIDPANKECEVLVKIADLGNACHFKHKSIDKIQTREYRALEVILGAEYSETVDIWSVACLLWELATKNYLFDIQSKRGKDGKDEAHLANIIEYCGHIPRYLIRNGKHSPNFFRTNGKLSNRESLKPTKLTNLLIRCEGWTTRNATEFVDFLMPMLNTDPLKRASACKALGSPYLCNILVRGIERESKDCTHPKSEKLSDEDSLTSSSLDSSGFSSNGIESKDEDNKGDANMLY